MNKAKIPSLVTIGILTVVTISFWIVFSVVRIFTAKPTPPIPPEVLAPLNPNYDKNVVDKIQGRLYFEQGQVPEFVAEVSPTPKPTTTPVPSPIATFEATVSGSPSP